MAGLYTGALAARAFADDSTAGTSTSSQPATHDCKGKNSCKGQGGCQAGDQGCKGKNSCSGKGGCKTSS